MAPLRTATVLAEPDAFDITRPQLMGRHTAGHGFLRAAVAARKGGPIHGYGRSQPAREGFAQVVRSIDPAAETVLVAGGELDRLSDPGVLYLGDPSLPAHARTRLRQGVAAYSLCGVTHTTASDAAMNSIADLLTGPVTPWDALVCTSAAVLETVRRVHEAEADYLAWRLGPGLRIEPPQLPVIPLGVHCADYRFDAAQRASARAALGIGEDEVTALFVGRLVFHGKAHPLPMYRALQVAAERTGKTVALVVCGWAATDSIHQAFVRGAADFAPDVRTIFVDGRTSELRDRAWAAGDLFVSLADGIQETFGLTPIEAKAAGLPLVVSDWNGYRDTVRHGVDGFRVPTWAPAAGMGRPIASGYETGGLDYEHYCWAAAASTAIDLSELFDAVTRLIADADLRREMGEAARRHAREVFDWAVVYAQYQALWGELSERRRAAAAGAGWWQGAPDTSPRRLDPFHAFGHYPTSEIVPTTRLAAAPGASVPRFRELVAHPLFVHVAVSAPVAEALLARATSAPLSVAEAAAAFGVPAAVVGRTAGLLAKMELLTLVAPTR